MMRSISITVPIVLLLFGQFNLPPGALGDRVQEQLTQTNDILQAIQQYEEQQERFEQHVNHEHEQQLQPQQQQWQPPGLMRPSSSPPNGNDALSPVVLMPGDGGSRLEAKLNRQDVAHHYCERKSNDWFDLWLNLSLLVPFALDCWIEK